MESNTTTAVSTSQGITSKVKEYIILQKELLKVQASDKVSEIATGLAVVLFFGTFLLVGIMAFTTGLGLYLNTVFNSDFAGFFAAGGLVILIGISLYYFGRKRLDNFISFEILKILNS